MIAVMAPQLWRSMLPLYLLYIVAFPAGMVAVELLPPGGPPVCLFRALTHLDCPSCGMTRAFRSLGKLDVRKAIGYNPLSPAVFLGALVCWGYAIAQVCRGGRLRLPAWWVRWQPRLVWMALLVYLLVGIGRMACELAARH